MWNLRTSASSTLALSTKKLKLMNLSISETSQLTIIAGAIIVVLIFAAYIIKAEMGLKK